VDFAQLIHQKDIKPWSGLDQGERVTLIDELA
jgi:hypothetical protein